jgi:hypothetical protein
MLRHKQHIGPIPVLTTTKAHTRKITDGRGGAINGMFRGDARGGKVGTNQTKQGQVTRQTQQGRKRAHGKYLTSLVPSGTNVPRQIDMRLANKIKAVSVSTSETKQGTSKTESAHKASNRGSTAQPTADSSKITENNRTWPAHNKHRYNTTRSCTKSSKKGTNQFLNLSLNT